MLRSTVQMGKNDFPKSSCVYEIFKIFGPADNEFHLYLNKELFHFTCEWCASISQKKSLNLGGCFFPQNSRCRTTMLTLKLPKFALMSAQSRTWCWDQGVPCLCSNPDRTWGKRCHKTHNFSTYDGLVARVKKLGLIVFALAIAQLRKQWLFFLLLFFNKSLWERSPLLPPDCSWPLWRIVQSDLKLRALQSCISREFACCKTRKSRGESTHT